MGEGLVDALVDLITVVKASLNDPQKPLGSFFFLGANMASIRSVTT